VDGDDDSVDDSELGDLLRAVAQAPPRPPMPSLMPEGANLGHYRIESKLGQGGMGVVYRATDEKLRRTVALKVLPPLHVDDQQRRRRFLREARSLAAVTHPNIATIYEVGEADGRIHIVMELVEGRSLRDALADGALSIVEATRITQAIARGLGKAHEKGIVHRDLKPDNVMLGMEGEVKILDFGLAKLRGEGPSRESGKLLAGSPTPDGMVMGLGSDTGPNALTSVAGDNVSRLTLAGQILGTPGYMSPEQAGGKSVDARSDIFSLGVLLYEMLAGTRPFKGESTLDILVAVSRDEPTSLKTFNPKISSELEAVVSRCLAKSPDGRFESARELFLALDTVVTAPVSVAPPVVPPRAAALGLGRLAMAAALGIAAVGVAFAVARPTSTHTSADPASLPSALLDTDARTPTVEKKPEGDARVSVSTSAEAVAPSAIHSPPRDAGRARHEAPHPSTAPSAAHSAPPTPPPAKPSCEPPYTIDSAGHRIPKPECL